MTTASPAPRGEVVLYEASDGELRLEVKLERESVWLSLAGIAQLFGRDKSVISRHLRNVFVSGELERESTVAKNATVQFEGDREVVREVEFFNLDAILSVGYRVNSKRGTQFRIWATRTLREHLVRGFTLNERRLRERGLGDIEESLALVSRTFERNALATSEGRAVLDVVRHYARTWQLLLAYDEDRLAGAPSGAQPAGASLGLAEARAVITRLRAQLAETGEATDLFGRERGEQLDGILAAIEQTFGGESLYPSVEARAAHLLYFVIKDHPFSDGNKRIGALLFLEYLARNGALLRRDGTPRFADNALVALALLTAESEPAQKDLLVRLTINLMVDPATSARA